MQPTVITQRVCCRHARTSTVLTHVGATQCHKRSAGKYSRPQLAARATVEQDTTSTEASRAEARRMRRETRDATDTTVDINPVSILEQIQSHCLSAQVVSTLLFTYTWLAHRQTSRWSQTTQHCSPPPPPSRLQRSSRCCHCTCANLPSHTSMLLLPFLCCHGQYFTPDVCAGKRAAA